MAVKGKSVALRPADCKQGGRDEPAGERCRLEVQKVEERGERAEGGEGWHWDRPPEAAAPSYSIS